MYIKREIYTYSAAKQLPNLLQGIVSAELLSPSKKLWLYSPWISNIPLLDNKTNSFRHVEPLWPRGMIKLSSILEKILERGTEVFIISNTLNHNNDIFLWIEQMNDKGYKNLKGLRKKEIHQKGLLGDSFYVKGSMNFTFNGLTTLDERIEFTCVSEEVAQAKIEFEYYWNENVNII